MNFKNIVISMGILIILIMTINYLLWQDPLYILRPRFKVENISTLKDRDNDGLNDIEDILQGARNEIKNKTVYRSGYYKGGYPPEDEGVCTDVIWRAYKNAGYDLKVSIDKDIKDSLEDYPRVNGKPDPNIDFRRVKNQHVFFNKYGKNLTLDVIPYDNENLKQWQPGDLVILKKPDHIAVISDKRRKDGVPYIIHNATDYPEEKNLLLRWSEEGKIIGHFRYLD
ncbi:DUF1287 domain-containing protein [Clostridium sp. D2Q-11]|uniref:DUF1287 domain-containing protein n=1 Tax=Anaeromonas frigoriresistens TaxID=2683708 RepID=A0A942UUT2_9FIRM|nr:DUF1287 domain-containing protein [Anaeromonas frigoriresistens]MBS4537251.1 DUF1287 domain-containing protein [Anaeromonas frigoriresistens]